MDQCRFNCEKRLNSERAVRLLIYCVVKCEDYFFRSGIRLQCNGLFASGWHTNVVKRSLMAVVLDFRLIVAKVVP